MKKIHVIYYNNCIYLGEELWRTQGKAMWQKKLEYPSGGFRLTVPTADLIRGEYIVVVNS